jgi:uncharacterized lipoprotein YehR (DUF1307 family)
MKNFAKLLGIAVIVAVIGFSMTGCPEEEKDELDGTTWEYSVSQGGVSGAYTITFNSPNFTMTVTVAGVSQTAQKGTYSVSGDTVTLTPEGGGTAATGKISGNKLKIGEMEFTKK